MSLLNFFDKESSWALGTENASLCFSLIIRDQTSAGARPRNLETAAYLSPDIREPQEKISSCGGGTIKEGKNKVSLGLACQLIHECVFIPVQHVFGFDVNDPTLRQIIEPVLEYQEAHWLKTLLTTRLCR